jgi:DNA-binding response OmpR family regulator
MNAGGTTIFLTTHQIEEANQLCDRVAIINHGQIAAIDTLERLKAAFRRAQSVEVAFEGDETLRVSETLRVLPGVTTSTKMGDKWRLYTEDPSAVVPRVVHYAEDHGLRKYRRFALWQGHGIIGPHPTRRRVAVSPALSLGHRGRVDGAHRARRAGGAAALARRYVLVGDRRSRRRLRALVGGMTKTSFHILLVEDESQTARMVRFYLEREGLAVVVAGDGPAGEVAFRRESPHLVILDLMLPAPAGRRAPALGEAFDGLELCRRIRQASTVPILMLTARAEETDKAIGLGIGADDYLTKPFSPTELIARVKALLRRAYQYSEPPRPARLGGPRLQLDPARRQVTLDGRPVDLTPTEFDLLHVLMANPGWAFTRSHLLKKVWGYSDEAGEDTVTAHISNLRRKLGPEGADLIRTVRGVGYAYAEEG